MLPIIMGIREPEEVAKQLNQYADYITAFAAAQSLAVTLGIANKDFREGVIKAGAAVVTMGWFLALVMLMASVILCYEGQDEILGKLSPRACKEQKWILFIRFGRFLVFAIVSLLQALVCYSLFKS